MTQEYKEALLKYLTGTIKEEDENGNLDKIIAYYENIDNVANNLKTYLDTNLGSAYMVVDVLQSESYDKYLIYGSRRVSGANYGWILITDSKYNPIKLITHYQTGITDEFLLGRFLRLELDEKNQVYGVDYYPQTQKYRFIMMNNILATEELVLRQSYNLPDEISGMTGYQVTKSPTSAVYLIAGIIFQGNINQPKVAKLTVNVGSENEWVYYEYAGSLLGAEGNLSDIFAKWDNDSVQFKMSAFSESQLLIYYSFYQDDQNLIGSDLYNIGENWITSTIHSSSSIIADEDTYYYGVHATADGEEVMAIFEIKNNIQSFVWAFPLTGSTTSDTNLNIDLRILNGTLFYLATLPGSETGKYSKLQGLYRENVVDTNTYVAENLNLTSYLSFFTILNIYNLYIVNIQQENMLYYANVLYNPTINFRPNSTGYNNPNDLKPLSMSLFQGNDVIFNRSLYNLTINSSIATATIEVPNTMLNNININKENLIGNHYLQITNNIDSITTNEYETLHINSINTLSMINEDTGVTNLQGASRLNLSVNNKQDYTQTIADKLKFNYNDNSSSIIKIDVSSQVEIINNMAIYTIDIYIPSDKTVSNIQFISDDETTVYQTIDNLTFESGKAYTLTQMLEVV